jgi:AraC-like DNA-binding protein
MNITPYPPSGILKDFVEYIVFLSGKECGTGIAFPRMHQVIIINLGTSFQVSDVYTARPTRYDCTSTVWVNGKQDVPFMLENKGTTAMYAIGLKLGMLPYFADLPAIETNDLAVGAEHWTSKEIFHLQEQLLACPDIRSGFILIEKYLTSLLVKRQMPNVEKIKWLDKAIRTHTVEDICHALGVTRKKLRSETQHYFGGSVKNIQGIIRLNKTLSDIAHHTGNTLSSVHNYYDQSHFINDFKARTGITPSQYRKLCLLDPSIVYTPNFISMQRETFLQFISI